MSMKKYILGMLVMLMTLPMVGMESNWQTHFAYNSVEVIANCPQEIYALANGAIFSVNKTTEAMTLYNSQVINRSFSQKQTGQI